MNLVTVASEGFKIQALNLIASYKKHSANKRIFFCVFGQLAEDHEFKRVVANFYGDQIRFSTIPQRFPHSWEPYLFFYKLEALRIGMEHRPKEPFLYLDAASTIIKPAKELEKLLEKRTRVLVSYPHDPFFRNERWTSQKCLEKLGTTGAAIRVASQYSARMQGYTPTADNQSFINRMYNAMTHPEVAGPSAKLYKPDGENGVCDHHLCDQSVLSLFIHQNGWHQPYDPEFFAKYGDIETLSYHTPNLLPEGAFSRSVIASRQFRTDFIPPKLKKRLNIP